MDRVIAGGADYLVVLGTTAETPTLSAEERTAVRKFVLEKNGGMDDLQLDLMNAKVLNLLAEAAVK